jgi:pimeloyl-ACP methyl ester carboxylesterase
VRIEEFGATHVVYVGGTVDGSLGASAQPWDMSSNLAALGGDAGASENAVRRAMTDAGIRQGDPVILVGHSQGGLVAMRVAQSPDVTAQAVITAGSPIHAMFVPSGVPVVAFEHTDDLVPALGGPVTHDQPGLVYVRGSGVDAAASSEPTVLPAHRLESYVETARHLDTRSVSEGSPADRLETQLQALPGSGTSTLWRATRTEAER